ncbi:MAG TPA: cupin domain-containing protein [Candidatus Udaeobacter sp.]|jgi:quercetin dioxygenase-like cupin family protein|nr:cupin domain-containing protein [Candidatus Udaeobacter sp.]
MALHVKAENVPERKVVRSAAEGKGWMAVKRAYGNECSLMHAVRAPDYHTTPHAHLAEQINYVLEGEIWFFVEDKAFQCKKGDFQRIPAHKIHWAWNRSDADAVVVEAHSPALVGGALKDGSVALFDEGEPAEVRSPSVNQFVSYDWQSVEHKIFGA